jgi:hypothetical protein
MAGTLTAAQQRAMLLGCELHLMNSARRDAARFLFAGPWPPARFNRGLQELARIDGRRRALRGLLAEQLELVRPPARHARPAAYTGPHPDDLLPGSREYWLALHAKLEAEGRFDDLPGAS